MGKRLVLLMIFFDLPLLFASYGMVWSDLAVVSEAGGVAWIISMLLLPVLIVVYNMWRYRGARGAAAFGGALFLLAWSLTIYGVRLESQAAERVVPERQTVVSRRYYGVGSFDHAKERPEERVRQELQENGRRIYQQMAEELRWEALPDYRPELLEREKLREAAAGFAGLLDPTRPELGYKVTVELERPLWQPADVFRQFMRGFVDMPEVQAERERLWRRERELLRQNMEALGGISFTQAEQIYQLQLAAAAWPEESGGWLAERLAALGYGPGELRLREAASLAEPAARQSVWQLVAEEAAVLGDSYPGLYQAELVRWEPAAGDAMPQGAIASLMQGEEPEGVRPVERLRILFHMDSNDAYQGRNYTNARYIAVLHEDMADCR